MLILTRRIGESIMVGDSIEITVVSVNRHQVRFGIEAPREIAVHRKEIYEKITSGAGYKRETPSEA